MLTDTAAKLAPINAFQRLVRAWEEPHPYNAGQALRLSGTPDVDRISRAWSETLATAGIGSIDANRGQYWYRSTSPKSVPVLNAGQSLDEHFTAALNEPFSDPDEPPFRPFIAPVGHSYYLGMVYQHWIADSIAIRLLLREWFLRLFHPELARSIPLPRPRTGYWDLFGPSHRDFRLTDVVLGVLRRHRRYRRSMKVQTYGKDDYPVRVLLRYAEDGLIDRLRDHARKNGMKLNDLFLAAAAETCAKFIPTQARDNRPDLAVGSIVDLRRHARRSLGETFGFYLGFTEVFCRPHELKDFNRLLSAVVHQNHQHRQSGIAPLTVGWLSLADIARFLVPSHERYHFHRKETPLVGGVSNVNVNGSWLTDYAPDPIQEFIRVSPTGPLVPVVFTLTTLGRKLQLSITVRKALLDEQQSNELAATFLRRLHVLGAEPSKRSV